MRALLITTCLLCLAGIGPAFAHGHGAPAPEGAAATVLAGHEGELARRMQDVSASVDALGHYEHGHLGPEQGVLLATRLESYLRGIIATCKLPPQRDAQLHAIVVPLMTHAATLKADPSRRDVIAPMRAAMAEYNRLFTTGAAASPASAGQK